MQPFLKCLRLFPLQKINYHRVTVRVQQVGFLMTSMGEDNRASCPQPL